MSSKTKRILEIKRGESVPISARWLGEAVRTVDVIEKREYFDDGMFHGYEDKKYPVTAVFDVFEIEDEEKV